MPMTNAERTFLKGGRAPNQGIQSNPNRYAVKKPMSFKHGTVWNGPQSAAEKLNANSGKWLSKDPTTKSGFAKNPAVAEGTGGGTNWENILKKYAKVRMGLDGIVFPGTAHAPSMEEMGLEPLFNQPTVWHNEGPTGRYGRQ